MIHSTDKFVRSPNILTEIWRQEYDDDGAPLLRDLLLEELGHGVVAFTRFGNILESVGSKAGTIHTGGESAIESSRKSPTIGETIRRPQQLGVATDNSDRNVVVV